MMLQSNTPEWSYQGQLGQLFTETADQLIGVQQYAKKRIAIYCDMANPYCDTYCDIPVIFISVYYCP